VLPPIASDCIAHFIAQAYIFCAVIIEISIMQVIALKLLILSLSIASAVGIHCYDCNSKNDPDCADPFERKGLLNLNCDNKPMHSNFSDVKASFCRKVYQKGVQKI
jgi:hypothetical protein